MAGSFESMWEALLPIGRDPVTGGYRRYVWSDAERRCREWFAGEATRRGLDLTTDRNGNLWAWWGDPDRDGPGVVTGSHLDSVPDGGAYDGPLGVLSAFAAYDQLRARGLRPARPLGIVAFADEEGARFGVACAGSRLLTGALAPDRARALTDVDGRTYAEVLREAGQDPERIGKDDETLKRIGGFVELHVEQGRALADPDFDGAGPLAIGRAIWPHGRWRFEFVGRADHAGSTRMEDRQDPMLTYAMTALAANKRARLLGRARATFGRVQVDPNSTNGIPSRVQAWMDARAETPRHLDTLLDELVQQATARAGRDHTSVELHQESRTDAVAFDTALADRIAGPLGDPPRLDTAAGHDAGILATAGIPTAMLYVRNPTGVSHSPEEYAELADCLTGVDALSTVLAELLA